MKHKILIAILSLTMVFSTGFSFAEDQEIPTEENVVKQEVIVEETTPTEEVKQEEEKEVITEEPKEEPKEEPQEPTNPPNPPNQEEPKQEESPTPVVPQTPEEPQTQPTVQEPEQPQVPALEPEQPTQEPVQPTSSEKDDLTILDDSVLQKDPLVQPKQKKSNVTNGLEHPQTTPAQRRDDNNNNNNNNYIPEIPANYLYNYVAEDAPTKQLTDTETPLAIGAVKTGSWALINLLAMLANFILSFLLICLAILNKNKEDEEIKINNKNKWRIGSIILAIVFAIIFFLTEDINLPMVLVDKWTLLMIIGFIIQLIFTFASKHKEEEQDE